MCAAWPYINTVPHLGTLIGSALSADVLSRFLRLKGHDVVFVSGSDEHGTPIEVQALKNRVTPKELTDANHAAVSDIFRTFQISFDNYTRTHNPIHIAFCQDFFRTLYDKGHIFVKETKQLFCNTCNRFLPDRFVQGTCPHCTYTLARGDQCDSCGKVLDPLDLIEPECSICGSRPVAKTSKHWFFDLSKFSDRLRLWLEKNERLPGNARKFSFNWIREGLKPRAITRDNQWGIPAPFPEADNKTIYVWFEALLGYITATIEWAQIKGKPESWKDYWLASDARSVYFVGKDNIPFHTIILPSLLMAYGESFVLPWNVSSTEYLTFEGQKFSKSRGIGVWLDQALEYFESDYWRYYLIKIRPEHSDTDFSWHEFQRVINSDLNDTLGNFVHRVLTFIQRYFEGFVPQTARLDQEDFDLLKLVETAPTEAGKLLEQIKEKQALEYVIQLAREGNVYLNAKEPWQTVKTDKSSAGTSLYVAIQPVKCLSVLLDPFIPQTARRIRELINLSLAGPSLWSQAGETTLGPGHKIESPVPLFSKILDDRIEQLKARTTVVT